MHAGDPEQLRERVENARNRATDLQEFLRKANAAMVNASRQSGASMHAGVD
jgi:hypothetical protein